MADFDDVQTAFRVAILSSVIKYSGGKIVNAGSQAKRVNTPANSTILHGHFTSGNKKIYKPLSPEYLAQKTKKVGKKPILVYSGSMKRRITAGARVYAVGKERFKVTFPRAPHYAKYHAEGSPFKKGLPKRHPTKPTKKDKDRFVRHLKIQMKTALAKMTATSTKHINTSVSIS